MTTKDETKTATKVYTGRKHDGSKKKSKESKKTGKGVGTALTVIIIIAAIAAVFAFTSWLQPVQEMFVDQDGVDEDETVIVKVNDQEITEAEFDRQWNILPAQMKMQVGKQTLLEDIINQRLLMQKAKEKGISTSDQEVEQFINQQLAQTGQTMEQFKQQLTMQNESYEDILEVYKKQLTIAKLFDTMSMADLNVTREDVETYYEENKKQFHHEKQATVRHILLEVNNQTSENETKALAENLTEQLDAKNNSNFCKLVTNYSMDMGSKDNCGEYRFEKGRMAPAFENASFSMDIGERETVNTSLGYHIILKMNESEAGYKELNDTIQTGRQQKPVNVSSYIEQQLTQERTTEAYDEYVGELKENATITYVNNDTIEESPQNTMGNQMIEINQSAIE